MGSRACLCWCDGHRAGLFSVVSSVRMKGNGHKLKYRKFYLYGRETLHLKSTRVPCSLYLGTIGMGCNWGGHCPLAPLPWESSSILPAPGELDSNSVGSERKWCSESFDFLTWFLFFFPHDILPGNSVVLTEELSVENEIKHFRSNWELGLEGATCRSVVSARWMKEDGGQRVILLFLKTYSDITWPLENFLFWFASLREIFWTVFFFPYCIKGACWVFYFYSFLQLADNQYVNR